MLAILATMPLYVILGFVSLFLGVLGLVLNSKSKKPVNRVKRFNKKATRKLNRRNVRIARTRWKTRKGSPRVSSIKTAPPQKKTLKQLTAGPSSKPVSSGRCGRVTERGKPCRNHNSPGKSHCYLHASKAKVS